MPLPTATPAHPSPQVVGAAFVQQYYHVLHQSPEIVHRFYQDSSILSRPDSDGTMTLVTTLQAINEKVLTFNFSSYSAEIETIDSLASYKEGVFIVVTGCLTGCNNMRRKFTQSFFLAPQDDRGYFVLNDIFRFVDQTQPKESNQILANGVIDDAPKAPLTPAPEPSSVQESQVEEDFTTPPSEGDIANHEELANQSQNGGSGVEDEVAVDPPVYPSQPVDPPENQETAAPVVQDNGPKKSYASIVKVMGNSPQKTISPAKAKAPPSSVEKLAKPSNASTKPATAPESKVPSSDIRPNSNSHDEEGYSIYIRNLPLNATVEQVEAEMKKFGPIKPNGIQVRNHKVDPFCFGFVEFESVNSMQAAIKASTIFIGDRQVHIEEKKTSTRVVNGVVISNGNRRGRFPTGGRGGFRNDNFKGNDNFKTHAAGGGSFAGNNQGYVRSEFRNRGEYSSRGRSRGPPGNTRDGFQQRPVQNGNDRIFRPVQTVATA